MAGTAAGFPWLVIAGKELAGWVVIDMDATLVTSFSDNEGAAPTWKKGYGFHPLGAWCRNTRECLAMLLRPGNAGSNTFADDLGCGQLLPWDAVDRAAARDTAVARRLWQVSEELTGVRSRTCRTASTRSRPAPDGQELRLLMRHR